MAMFIHLNAHPISSGNGQLCISHRPGKKNTAVEQPAEEVGSPAAAV